MGQGNSTVTYVVTDVLSKILTNYNTYSKTSKVHCIVIGFPFPNSKAKYPLSCYILD